MTRLAPVVSVAEAAAPDAAHWLRVDCRFALAQPAQGRLDYLAGHLPGAVYANLDTDLSDPDRSQPRLGRHPLPSAEAFARTLGRWGWQPGQPVLAYDAASGAMAAARLWWLLRAIGAPACVLDGGLTAWRVAGQPVETGMAARTSTSVSVRFDSAGMVTADQLREDLAVGALTLLDARGSERFRGEREPIDPRAGHVPGARNRPFMDNLDAAGCWRPAAELRAEFGALTGGSDPRRVAHMCGSGVTACHNLLAMEYAGLSGARLYAPSWSGWVADPANPIATGP